MSRRKAPRARGRGSPFYWTQVTRHLHCSLGVHEVEAGKWVRFTRNDIYRLASCEDCLRARGIERPARPITMTGTVDVRQRRLGEDE